MMKTAPVVRKPYLLPGVVCLVALIVLAGCGSENHFRHESEATPAGSPTSDRTVGVLADRFAAAWPSVTAYRSTTTTAGNATPAASPVASTLDAAESVILPDRRYQVVTADGEVESEIIAIDGSIYGRGPNLPGIAQPNRNPDFWITINGNVLGPNNQSASFYQSLLEPVQPPYAGLTDAERSRETVSIGSIEILGRTCEAYRIAETTLTGDRIEVVVSIDAGGLPCAIETVAGGSTTTTTFDFAANVEIAAPASPVPAPAENG